MQILTSPWWTPLGVVAGIVLGFLGIYITLGFRNRKALTYEVLFNTPLVTIEKRLSGQGGDGIEIRYHGTPVQNVRMVSVRVWNSGNVAIQRSDFDKPIYIEFDGRLLDVVITETIPPHIEHEVLDRANTDSDHSGVQFQSLLLNPRESVTIQAILADSRGTVDLRARIVGVSDIKRYDEGNRAAFSARAITETLVMSAVATLLVALVETQWLHINIMLMSSALLSALVLGFIIAAATGLWLRVTFPQYWFFRKRRRT